jgi:hypothetical protein
MLKKKGNLKKKRDLDKYPALNPRLNAKTRFEVLDMDYLKKLDDAELKFMNQFMAEYVSGAFKKTDDGTYSSDNFHKTVDERRECYSRNNTRNRCGLTISNATGQTYRCDDISAFMDSLTDVDSMVEFSNAFSNKLHDEFDGSYDVVEQELMTEMLEDFNKCRNPKTSADKKLAESNYGKMLLLKFKNIKLIEES